MPPSNLRSAVEALLFSSDQPVTLALLSDALESPAEEVSEALRVLGEEYSVRQAGVELREMAGGWVFTTASEQHPWVTRMLRGKRKMRLSRAALETMAIIAYKQPVTKSEVEAIRGVDASGVLATLLERNLVTIRGRSTVVGRPLLYGSTSEFLNYFGLRDLTELPRPEELRALVAAREPEQLEMMELDPESGMPLSLAEANGGAPEDGEAAAPAAGSEAGLEPAFSIADADAAIAAANAARGEAVLAMSSDMQDASDETAGGGDEETFGVELEGEDDEDEFDDAYEDDDDDEEDEEDGDEEAEDDQPSALLAESEPDGR